MARNEITSDNDMTIYSPSDNDMIIYSSSDNDMIIYSSSENVVVEISDAITFWSSLIGKPSDSKPLVDFLNSLLEGKQDLIYFIVNTELDKESIKVKKTGSVVFVKETQKLYIYYAETPEWTLINQDLSVFYNKDEVDDLLALKANISDVYSKIEADERFATILDLDTHKNNKNNPHEVTKSQVGLSNVENLAPLDMPISNATQQALDGKQNTITGAVSNVTDTNLPPNKVVVTNAQGKLATDDINISGLEMLEGLTGNVQDQLDGKEDKFNKNTAFNKNFTTNLSNIKMDGVRSLGTSNEIPRADHVHPSDTSKVDANAPISSGTYTKISYDSKGLVTGGSNLQASDIPVLTQYELKVNKVNEITDSTIEYPTTKAVKNALAPKADKTYVDASIAEFSTEINSKENKFDKNTAFNKNFATDKQEFQMDGEAFAGTSNEIPRADHVHPSDTSREAVANKTDSYSYNSSTLYPSTRALYHGLKTRLKPENVIGGSRINVVVDGERIIINSYGGTTTAMWGGIIGDIQDQTDLMAKLSEKADTTDIHDGTLTIQVNGTDLATFTANDEDDVVANIVVPDSATWGNITGDLADQTDLSTALGNKVDKTSTANKVYGTDTNGNQTTYDVDSFGQVDDVTVGGTSVVTNKVAQLGTMAGETASNYILVSNIVNDVVSTDTNKPLSANMGKELQDQIDNLKAIGRFLSIWNCSTGLPATNPTVLSYQYSTGDYYLVGTVASGGTNYKPNGSEYTGTASTTVETDANVAEGDVYVFDGTKWVLQYNTGKEVTFANIAGDPYDNSNLASALNDKQDELPSQTGQSGKFLTTNGTDISWGDVTIPVTDVQINSTSILSNGVANIPLATNFTNGVLHPTPTFGTTMGANGFLMVSDAFAGGESIITNKQDAYRPLTSRCIDLAVKVGVTTNTNTLTDTEKQNACNWIGALTKDNIPVKDVQVNGTSVLSGDVANIPVAYGATKGVVLVRDFGYGIKSTSTGQLQIHSGDWAKFKDALTSPNKWLPIVTNDLLLGMKAFLGTTITSTTSNTTWDDTEKANARNTIGATQAVIVDWS